MSERAERIGRRTFLDLGWRGALAATLAPKALRVASARATSVRGTVLGPGRIQREGAPTLHSLSVLDLDAGGEEPWTIELDFFGHGLTFDPTDPHRAALFEKRGSGACILDLENRRVVRPIPAGEREFYGHGSFSPDGSLLYSTEILVSEDYRGVIVVRDGATLEELGEFPTYGESPHDCVLRDDGRTLVVTNGGSRVPGGDPPSVTYVDVESRELVERVTIENPDVGAGHLALTLAGDLAVVSAPREWMSVESVGAASFRTVGGVLRTMEEPRETTGRLKGESLSLAIHEPSGIVGVTNPLANLLTFWELTSGRLVRSLDLAYPRGIALTLDGERFVVSYGKSTSLVEISTADLEPVRGSRRSSLAMNGSHVVVRDLR